MSERADDAVTDAADDAGAGADTGAGGDAAASEEPTRPTWDDAYLDDVAERLQYSFDLERDVALDGETWPLSGELNLEREKYFLHPSISYGRHDSDEHLFVRRADALDTDALDDLVDLGHRLADERITANERHYSTEFTFALVVPGIDDAVRDYVAGFRERTLLKYGYYGHYEVNLVVVAPGDESCVASAEADVADAFRTWRDPTVRERGLFGRVADAIFG
ncbi:hypothetical protein J2752_001802 [Halarchaeum rubridurum]|uniref:DUF8052 domain-containing protein n=1 Tax=Halarchaeum rubridurum TaxID=489911 RepID=A0A830G174_9EURY|nr:hypothetical protein [Halarchaeum rubridurum]MBP1954890.1 hypothetical protein [Halarchaeum rubridurum]GGM70591.1 hypothetical protein GCM10009017_21000 [Halarchaeum rubridurum]